MHQLPLNPSPLPYPPPLLPDHSETHKTVKKEDDCWTNDLKSYNSMNMKWWNTTIMHCVVYLIINDIKYTYDCLNVVLLPQRVIGLIVVDSLQIYVLKL